MKTKLNGKIHKMAKRDIDGTLWVQVELDVTGAVENEAPTAKGAEGLLILRLKSVVAEKLCFGQMLTVTIETEGP